MSDPEHISGGLAEVFGRMAYGDDWKKPAIDETVKRAPGRFSFGVMVGITLSLAVVFMIGIGCYAAWMAVVG